MKIRDRLTWTLSLSTLIAIAILSILLYYFTAKFHEQEFFTRLEERVAITELIFLENDAELESTVRDRFLQTLDEEKEYAISFKPAGKDSMRNMFPEDFANRIKIEKKVNFRQGPRQGVGIHYYLPKGEYAVVVTAVDTFGQRKLNFLRKLLLFGGLAAVFLLGFVDRLALTRALKPLENKIQEASSITADRLDVRLQVDNPEDEIGKVARAFNNMLDRLQNSFEAQKLFVRNASHEIRNPLTAISGEAEVLLQKKRSSEEYQSALFSIHNESKRLQILMDQLLDLEKTDALSSLPSPEPFPIDQCLLESVELLQNSRFKLEIDLKDDEQLVYGSPYLIQTALANVLENALKYSDEEDAVTVEFSSRHSHHLIRIIDKGVGIPKEDLEKIFLPFFRSTNARRKKGHGIGLALVKNIIELHKGKIIYFSRVGKGTSVDIYLPVYRPKSSSN
ncbi:MAG: ATP-binding protein [Bacteroidota bacterium]